MDFERVFLAFINSSARLCKYDTRETTPVQILEEQIRHDIVGSRWLGLDICFEEVIISCLIVSLSVQQLDPTTRSVTVLSNAFRHTNSRVRDVEAVCCHFHVYV